MTRPGRVVVHFHVAGEREILAERTPDEAVVGQQAPQIGMAGEHDPVKVEGFAFERVRSGPHADQRERIGNSSSGADTRTRNRQLFASESKGDTLRQNAALRDRLRHTPSNRHRRDRSSFRSPVPDDRGARASIPAWPRTDDCATLPSATATPASLSPRTPGSVATSGVRPHPRAIVLVRQIPFWSLQDAVEQCLGRRWTAGNIHVDRHDTVATAHDRVRVVVVAPAIGTGAHRDHPARLGHLVVHLAQGRGHLVAQRPRHDHHVGLARTWDGTRRRSGPGRSAPRRHASSRPRNRPDRTSSATSNQFAPS